MHPAVVLVHGSGPNDRDETIGPNKPFRDLAWGLAERGIVVLRYDKRSYARPDDLAAVGEDLTVREEVIDDVHAALSLLWTVSEVDDDAVFVLGHSLGGAVVPRIAAEYSQLAGIVVLAGSTLPLPEKMLSQTIYIAELDGQVSEAEKEQITQLEADVTRLRRGLRGEEAITGFILGAPLGYYRDLEEHDPVALAAEVELPTLVLQGSRDYQVTLDDFRRWERALSDRSGACLKLYEGLDHLFRSGDGPPGPHDYDRAQPMEDEVIEDIAAWMKSIGRCEALSRN
jgi:alpha-beta hydrolase superfamily lysophospholipase